MFWISPFAITKFVVRPETLINATTRNICLLCLIFGFSFFYLIDVWLAAAVAVGNSSAFNSRKMCCYNRQRKRR